jgi:hypothetical protein
VNLKSEIIDHIKNIGGFTTSRKIVVFSVDDYGNVRLDSKQAKSRLKYGGVKLISHFDNFDSLETREDLEVLFECLTSVKDKNNSPAVFSPFALPCNIDFYRMEQNKFEEYAYENLDRTFLRLENQHYHVYNGTWRIWKEGIELGLLRPQFHGREHLNLKVLSENLQNKDDITKLCLENYSYAGILNHKYPTISYTAAFDFWRIEENNAFESIIKSGVENFKEVFGYPPIQFNAPGATASSIINKYLFQNGIKFIDNPFLKSEHLGLGHYRKSLNYTGKKIYPGLTNLNRNVVFEPTEGSRDWVAFAMRQIEIAFKCKKPAIISSHRVNFCGNIDERNRQIGIHSLKMLLKNIARRWPDVEFLSTEELCKIIRN